MVGPTRGRKRLGIIGGTSLVERARDLEMERLDVETPYGDPSSPLMVGSWGGAEVAMLVRHGLDHDIPPHRINHRANIQAMVAAGVGRLVLVASVGSLRPGLRPPMVMLMSDFVSPFDVPTFHDDRIVHITPTLSEPMRHALSEAATEVGVTVIDGGVYVQTRGPRLETRAEVRALAPWGDVVGMTLASEATLALERGLEVAGICSVDNLAHGISATPLEYEDIKRNAASNWRSIERVLRAAAARLRD
jgi:5'-methylthioadenosine phosphorylase